MRLALQRGLLLGRHTTSVFQLSRCATTKSVLPEGTTLSRQGELKRFPVPVLQDTLAKYLKSVPQFLDKQELEATVQSVREFEKPGGVGQRLQKMLEEKASKSENWLADWWLDLAYLTYRDPVVVWSSPGIVWPRRDFNAVEDQLDYAARVVAGLIDFKKIIDVQVLPVETMGPDPMDMAQYFRLFGTTRIPGEKADTQSFNSSSRHIVVMHNNYFFKMQVYCPNGIALPESQILGSLRYILQESESTGAKGEPVGLLTSDNRDNWYKARRLLVEGGNEEALREVETALFTVSLDDDMDQGKDKSSLARAAAFAIHGGGPNWAAGNRWFDKTIQIFVCRNGDNGMTYEHSPAEAVALMTVTNHVIYCANGGTKHAPPNMNPASGVDPPSRIRFQNLNMVQDSLKQAHNNLNDLTQDLELNPLHFKAFGKSFIKNQKYSPDSFLQMAFQLAFYRLHRVPGGHYESGGLRIFKDGRTDIIRSCSAESVEFAKAMVNEAVGSKARFKAMDKAIKGHSNYAKMAVQGAGVDRHLLGLKLLASENGLDLPSLYTDPSYKRSNYHRISSSQVSGKYEAFVCFGPLVMDGYGICYNIRDQDLIIGLSNMKSCKDTSVDAFNEALDKSLIEMHDLCVSLNQKAKL